MKGEVSGGSKASGKGFLICYDQDTLYTCMNLSKDKLKRLQKKVTQNMSRPGHPHNLQDRIRAGHTTHTRQKGQDTYITKHLPEGFFERILEKSHFITG